MGVREIAARLNAKTIRLDIGRGGIPELTDQDVAGAIGLAMAVNDALRTGDDPENRAIEPLAFGVWCLLWWPDGAALDRGTVHQQLRDVLYTEYAKRSRDRQLAQLDHHIAETELVERRRCRSEKAGDVAEVARLRAAAARAQKRTFPGQLKLFPVLLNAVIAEIVTPRRCPTCAGRGNVKTDVGPRRCRRCKGTCVRPMTKMARADALGVTEGAYRASWEDMYEWVYDLVSGLETGASRAIGRALYCDEPSPAKAEEAETEGVENS